MVHNCLAHNRHKLPALRAVESSESASTLVESEEGPGNRPLSISRQAAIM